MCHVPQLSSPRLSGVVCKTSFFMLCLCCHISVMGRKINRSHTSFQDRRQKTSHYWYLLAGHRKLPSEHKINISKANVPHLSHLLLPFFTKVMCSGQDCGRGRKLCHCSKKAIICHAIYLVQPCKILQYIVDYFHMHRK